MDLEPNSLDGNGNKLEHELELEDMKRTPIYFRGNVSLPLPEFSPIGQRGLPYSDLINKTPLCNGNCPITNLITEMGVADTVGHARPLT